MWRYSIFLVLLSCAAPKPGRCDVYHYHTTFPERWKPDVEMAIAKWNIFSGESVTISDTSEDTQCSFRTIPWGGPEYAEIKSEFGDFMGARWGRDRSIIITTGDYTSKCEANIPECIVRTSQHELGHAAGMEHLKGCAVMNPEELISDFSEKDREEYDRARKGY